MKTFEQYSINDKDKEMEMEELFLELSHLDELEIRFDFISYYYELMYTYNDICLFEQDKINKNFFMHYYKIWRVIEKIFNLNYDEIDNFMPIMADKYFKLIDYATTYQII